jgi:ribonuclease Z
MLGPRARRAPLTAHLSVIDGPGDSRIIRVVSRDLRLELPNGLFGDPLVVVRLRWVGRVLLLDAGDTASLGPRTLLAATDVLISHPHVDHMFGLGRLLRLRLGRPERPLRLLGPADLTRHVSCHLAGYAWNLVPAYPLTLEVVEVHEDAVETWRFPADHGFEPYRVDRRPRAGGEPVWADQELVVRAARLDHGGLASVAWRLDQRQSINVDPVLLAERGLAPGAWLNDLKAALAADADQAVTLPDGRLVPARSLHDIVRVTPGDSLVYAADAAPEADNAAALTALARGARRLIIESHYAAADRELAERNAHLTTADAAAIARAADVAALCPFHLSPRYADPAPLLEELRAHAGPVPIVQLPRGPGAAIGAIAEGRE